MKKQILIVALLATFIGRAAAIDNNTVEIVYNGTTASVTIAKNISSYVTDASEGSSHVVLTQSSTFSGNSYGEITYILSGTSADGEFFLQGGYKCTVELSGLTLTNPSGPALNIQNGKRVKLSVKSSTVNTLADGANEEYNGCLHCKGHTEFKGKGTLNVIGNAKHAVYSKEYIEFKNVTLNITGAVKDGIHCKEYFLMEGGTINIDGVQDDGIQVELSGTASTGELSAHEDEDSGNLYMEDGELTISNYGSKAIKADGAVSLSGGTKNFDTSDVTEYASSGIAVITDDGQGGPRTDYDLSGRKRGSSARGVIVTKIGKKATKKISK